MFLAQQMSGSMPPGPHHHPGIPDPSSGAKPLPVPPELAALRASGAMGQQVSSSVIKLNQQIRDPCLQTLFDFSGFL